MTEKEIERDNLIKLDRSKRNELINKALKIGISNIQDIQQLKTVEDIKLYYQLHYSNYSGNILTQEQYKASDFWFNDAGFQFEWRNFESNIQLECLTWKQVKQLINKF